MNATVIFVHSAGPQGQNQGSSNLIAYLEEMLSNKYNFIDLNMPTPEDPKYVQWREEIEKRFKRQTGEVILIGHSLGGSVLLKLLSEETYEIKIAGLFIVAAPFWGIDDEWQRIDFILDNKFERRIKDIQNIFLYHSLEEKIVPFSHHIAYAEKLPQGIRRELKGKQHLFENGLPELISDIRNLSSN